MHSEVLEAELRTSKKIGLPALVVMLTDRLFSLSRLSLFSFFTGDDLNLPPGCNPVPSPLPSLPPCKDPRAIEEGGYIEALSLFYHQNPCLLVWSMDHLYQNYLGEFIKSDIQIKSRLLGKYH